MDKRRYQRLVGKLIYLSHTKPDGAFLVSVVSQFMNNATEEHMKVVFRILRYLKMTLERNSSSKEHRRETLKFLQMRTGMAP